MDCNRSACSCAVVMDKSSFFAGMAVSQGGLNIAGRRGNMRVVVKAGRLHRSMCPGSFKRTIMFVVVVIVSKRKNNLGRSMC